MDKRKSRKMMGQTSSASKQVDNSNQKKMLQGSFWMTAGSLMSRILGALYVIPWVAMFGSFWLQGNALFSKGYNIYSLFLMASTAGVPSAVSKLVARYNAQQEYNLAFRLYKKSLQIGLVTGFIAAGILWFGAPWLAAGDVNVIPVLHSLAPAVFVIPVMSMTRGFLQGNNQMVASAMSQFIEQLVRVIYMLFMTWMLLILNNGAWQDAVVQSTFAAFVGALGGIAVLAWTLWNQRNWFILKKQESLDQIKISEKSLIWQVVKQAIPFVIVGSAIQIYQIIDQYSFFKIMQIFSDFSYDMLNRQYAIFDFNANKLIMIVISLAVALGTTAIPLLAAAHVRKNNDEIASQIRFTLELFMFVMIPAAIGMAAIAQPLYVTFYGYDSALEALSGTLILQFSSFLGIMFGLFTLLSTITQGVSRNDIALKALFYGVLLKLTLQIPAVALLGAMGPLVASMGGFLLASGYILYGLQKIYQLKLEHCVMTLNWVTFAALIMGGVSFGITQGMLLFVSPTSRLMQIMIIIMAVSLGGLVYSYIMLKTKIPDQLLGNRVAMLRRKLRIKLK
ncbi:polysaccharide biosynthesis protein [Periweissella beninensis]|uniref:Polysaccharide biosynthesis protein n=2 Tax=Periweissella beninensis TaxID=504936 RepID=A0ABT0VFL9_9LACO|nr:polysaccharide biosynthesis protein [Periweissella beninensis]